METSKEEIKRELQEASLSLDRIGGPLGGLTTFGMSHGWVEAIVKGMRVTFLKPGEYKQLVNCNTLDEVKLVLGDTEYGSFLANASKLVPETIMERVRGKWVQEFQFLRSQATGALSTFLDFITYEYLISAISYIISCVIRGSDASSVLAKVHPLGKSPHLNQVLLFEQSDSRDSLVDLYFTVLVDTPVAPYFEQYFSRELKTEAPGREIQRAYTDSEIDIITNRIQKLWLEDFYEYCRELGGETWGIMKELLEFEADRRAIEIMINSFGTQLNEQIQREKDRKELFCSFGQLYPNVTMDKFDNVGDLTALQAALAPYPRYRDLFTIAAETGTTVVDQLYHLEVALNRAAFDGQSHFASFWAFVKLKQQEERNLKWILACLTQNRPERDRSRWVEVF